MKENFMSRKRILMLFKFILVAGIFIFLYKTGRIEFSKLSAVYLNPGLFAAANVLVFLSSFIAVERWRALLRIHKISIGYWYGCKLTFVGAFFSAVIPGAVSGDIMRAYYIARGEQEKEALILSVVFDRLIGLYTIVLSGTVALGAGFILDRLSGQNGVWAEPAFISLGMFVLAVFLGMTAVGMAFRSTNIRRSVFIETMLKKLPFSHLMTRIYDAVHEYGQNPLLMFKAVALSIISQIPLYIGMWFIIEMLHITALSVIEFLVAIPVCFLINAIPLAPGGLGVGEVGFMSVFLLFGSHEGAELSMIFHLIFFVLSLGFGGLVYLVSDISKKELERIKSG